MYVCLALLAILISLRLPFIGHTLEHLLGHFIAHVFVHLGEHHPFVLIGLSWSAVLSVPVLLLLGWYWSAGSVCLVLRIISLCLDPGRVDIHKYEHSSVKRQGRGDTA